MGRALLLGTIFLALFKVGETAAIEWSKPIQITHTDGEDGSSRFQLEPDSRGFFHLLYRVSSYQGRHENVRDLYVKVNNIGETVIGPIYLSGLRWWADFAVDESGTVYFLSSREEDGYQFFALDSSGDTLVQAHNINELRSNWLGQDVRQNYLSRPHLVYCPAGYLVYESLIDVNWGQENMEFILTYTRLTLTGEVLDSTFALKRYPNPEINGHDEPRTTKFAIRSDGTIYYVWDLVTGGGVSPRISIIAPDNRILLDAQIPQRFDSTSVEWGVSDIVIDDFNNVYLSIWEIGGTQNYCHIQKMSIEGEFIWDNEIAPAYEMEANFTLLNYSNNNIRVIHQPAHGPNGEAVTSLSFNTDGELTDTVQYINLNSPFRNGQNLSLTNNGNDIALFYVWSPNGSHNDVFMIRNIIEQNLVDLNYSTNTQFPIVSVFPNPTNGMLNINIKSQFSDDWLINMTDINGRLIAHQLIHHSTATGYYSSQSFALPELTSLNTGTYFIESKSKLTGFTITNKVSLIK